METNKKNGSIVVIVVLTILVVVLGGYIVYDKFLNDNNTNINEENSTNKTNAKNENENPKEDDTSQDITENNGYLKTRICAGIYSGNAAITQNALTGEYDTGTLTIELKTNGTYELKKDNISNSSGEYSIIDNTLLLKTAPDICGGSADCSAKYSQYLSISDDCSSISWGYGSYFFDPDFTLNKQNN